MMRRFRRSNHFEVSITITDDTFIRPPREAQRNWLVNRALNEFVADVEHLDELAPRFVAGIDRTELNDRSQTSLADEDIMEDWQVPIMQEMARVVTEQHGDVLEVGFGRGLSSTYIQSHGVRSHTIVECNDSVIERFYGWKKQYPDRDIRLVRGKWQDTTDQLGMYDGIFFHTYPLDESEFVEYVAKSVTFAGHFFPTAARHLKENGLFTYLTNEIDSFSRAHQRLVFAYFRSFTLHIVDSLALPPDSRDNLWADSMVVIKAVK